MFAICPAWSETPKDAINEPFRLPSHMETSNAELGTSVHLDAGFFKEVLQLVSFYSRRQVPHKDLSKRAHCK